MGEAFGGRPLPGRGAGVVVEEVTPAAGVATHLPAGGEVVSGAFPGCRAGSVDRNGGEWWIY